MKRNSFAPSLWGRRALSALLALALCLGLLPGAVFAGETPETGGQTPKILASRTLREAFAEEEDLPFGVEIIALPDRFIPHGSVSYQMKQVGFTPEDICGRIEEYYRKREQEER